MNKKTAVISAVVLAIGLAGCSAQSTNETTKKVNKIVTTVQTSQDQYIGTWVTTKESKEKNVTLDITKNTDGSYHFVYHKNGEKREADYTIGTPMDKSGNLHLFLKSGKDVFRGPDDADAVNFVTKGSTNSPVQIGGAVNTDSNAITEYDLFIKQ